MIRRILVVEDEAHLAAGLKLNLELEGYVVEVAASGREAAAKFLEPGPFDAVVLDVMLPDTDGFELCRRLRAAGNYVPVIMLTARTDPEDRVRGLDAGADDYLGKPFELPELIARLRSLARRRGWDDDRPPELVTIGGVRVDFDRHEVEDDSGKRSLTRLEIELVRYFATHPGRVISREELLEQVWKLRDYPNTRTVDNFILRLRKVFEQDPSRPRYFLSHRGSGYSFVPDPA